MSGATLPAPEPVTNLPMFRIDFKWGTLRARIPLRFMTKIMKNVQHAREGTSKNMQNILQYSGSRCREMEKVRHENGGPQNCSEEQKT